MWLVLYFNSGGYDGSIRNTILEYDPETKKWIQIGTMREARREPAVTDEDYADFCH